MIKWLRRVKRCFCKHEFTIIKTRYNAFEKDFDIHECTKCGELKLLPPPPPTHINCRCVIDPRTESIIRSKPPRNLTNVGKKKGAKMHMGGII